MPQRQQRSRSSHRRSHRRCHRCESQRQILRLSQTEPDTETQAEPEPQAEVSLVRELEPELTAELEIERAAEPEPQPDETQGPEQEPQQHPEPEPEPAAEPPQAMSDWSEHTTGTLKWASDQTLAPAAAVALRVAFANDGIAGQDLTELKCRRLEKMLARQGCDDADTVAQAVLAARDRCDTEEDGQRDYADGDGSAR